MSPRSVFRYQTWRIRPESPENTVPTFQYFCTTCAAPGVPDEDAEAAQASVFAHLATHPTHTGYREEITRHWRADLLPGPTSPTVPVTRRSIP